MTIKGEHRGHCQIRGLLVARDVIKARPVIK